ncbi:hypothetical protein HUJ05_012748 [Dendroctonus ponderosae]|nr:hypothetical protein HUJ05_012748 [Dendroctonus ponderosae]
MSRILQFKLLNLTQTAASFQKLHSKLHFSIKGSFQVISYANYRYLVQTEQHVFDFWSPVPSAHN